MTSLVVVLGLGGTAAAQPALPAVVDWHPAMPKPVPPPMIQQAQFVQVKPGGENVVPPIPPPQQPSDIGGPGDTRIRERVGEAEFEVRTEPPGLDRLTRRVSEAQFQREIVEESRIHPGGGPIYFPEEEPVSTAPFTPRQSPPSVHYVEPFYVSHKPLYFEQKNWERYGWSLGPLDPAIQLATFFYDVVMLPYHIGADACHCYDTSAGKCLPGDPVPLLLYQERLSVTGAVFEAGTILGGLFIFP
jgi:hypothetical protein